MIMNWKVNVKTLTVLSAFIFSSGLIKTVFGAEQTDLETSSVNPQTPSLVSSSINEKGTQEGKMTDLNLGEDSRPSQETQHSQDEANISEEKKTKKWWCAIQ